MIYLYLDKNKIKLLSLSRTILGQHHFSFFKKNHNSDLLENGQVKNIDLLASAIKEAITLASPLPIKEKDVSLILPQQSFFFARYDIPSDLSETAIVPFIKDKIRVDISVEIEDLFFDYLTTKQKEEKKVLFFGQKKKDLKKYEETLRLLNLSLKFLLPETLVYFQLFKKTLREEKKENILYVFFEKENSYGYLYDSFGLIKKERYIFNQDLEASLRLKIEELAKEGIKINRVILSGKDSEKVRQDLFTKNVGAWTNPLKKIILNFYQDYLKLIIISPQSKLSLLDFDTCFGAFVFEKENKQFSLFRKELIGQKRKTHLKPKFRSFSIRINFRDILIFVVAFIFSFVFIFLMSKFSYFTSLTSKKIVKINPPSPTPFLPTPTPTPSLKKETLKIKVLNGSGVRGKASEVKETLKEKGYGEIITGNADSFDYEKTEIQFKEKVKEAFDYLKKDLSEYVMLEKKSSLPEDSAADVVLIIGKDFK